MVELPEILGGGAGFAIGMMLLPLGGMLYLLEQVYREFAIAIPSSEPARK